MRMHVGRIVLELPFGRITKPGANRWFRIRVGWKLPSWIATRACVPSERLERYVLNFLSPGELAGVEEHLLICENCRRRLVETEELVSIMRAALRECRNTHDAST